MPRRKKPVEGKIINKREDNVWREWYSKLTPADHDKMLAKLGLDEEDREEFFEESNIGKPQTKPKTKSKKGKKKK